MSELPEFTVRNAGPRKPKKPKVGVHVVFCLVLLAGTATIVVLYQQYQIKLQSIAASTPDEEPEDPAIRQARIDRWRRDDDRSPVEEAPKRDGGLPTIIAPLDPADAPPKPPPISPAKQQALAKAVAGARDAMSRHNLSKARSRFKLAESNAQTEEDKALVEQLDIMLAHLEEFWVGARESIASLKGGDEFTAGGTVIIVVEINQQEVTVRAVGQNRTYPLDDLPYKMVLALSEKWFADTPASKVLIGTYLAIEPKGDPTRARQLWDEATGQGIDLDAVMPEFEYWEKLPRVARSVAELRDRPPAENLVKDTRRRVVEQYSEDYSRANTMSRKAELARKLLDIAEKDGEPIFFLAVLHEAKAVAVSSGEVATACEAIDRIAEYTTFDVLADKATALEEASPYVRGLANSKELVDRALELMDEALATQRNAEAKTLHDLATKAAEKSKNASLVRRTTAAAKRLGEPEKEE